jgi:hypothetical protein
MQKVVGSTISRFGLTLQNLAGFFRFWNLTERQYGPFAGPPAVPHSTRISGATENASRDASSRAARTHDLLRTRQKVFMTPSTPRPPRDLETHRRLAAPCAPDVRERDDEPATSRDDQEEYQGNQNVAACDHRGECAGDHQEREGGNREPRSLLTLDLRGGVTGHAPQQSKAKPPTHAYRHEHDRDKHTDFRQGTISATSLCPVMRRTELLPRLASTSRATPKTANIKDRKHRCLSWSYRR